jgi:hypothetical protein
MAKVELGISAQRIYQDLVGENGFTDSYQSVKRFVRKLREAQPERIWRLECQPGEELQLDFGLGAPIDDGQGKRRRSSSISVELFGSVPLRPGTHAPSFLSSCILRPRSCRSITFEVIGDCVSLAIACCLGILVNFSSRQVDYADGPRLLPKNAE